jgi:prepilin-type processing-associated H-X9-DG protein
MQTKMTLGIPQETLAKVPALVLPAIKQARQAALANVSRNNLKQIALALHNYHDTHKTFPPAVKLDKDGKTPHSWRVAILPYIEEQALYNQYRFDEPWDSENNKRVAATIPAVYRSPTATNGNNCTSYVALTHANGVFNATPAAKGTKMAQVTDGTSNTVVIVEANAEIPWTKPEDIAIVDGQPLPQLGFPGATTFNVAFCDGSVQQLTTKLTDEFRKLITKSDGNVVDVNSLRPQDGGGQGQPQPPRFESSTKSPAFAPDAPAPSVPVPVPAPR